MDRTGIPDTTVAIMKRRRGRKRSERVKKMAERLEEVERRRES